VTAPNGAEFSIVTHDNKYSDGLFEPTEVSISFRRERPWSTCSYDVDLVDPDALRKISECIILSMYEASAEGHLHRYD
jgi:hypothetical protein